MPAELRPGDPNDIRVCIFEIEHEDVFHLKNLYKRMYDWMVDEGWKAAEGDDQNYETLYWQRDRPGDAQEHHIWWRAYRVPEGNRYYRYFLKIDFQTLNMKKVEVMHKGAKFGTNKGDVILRIEAHLQLDYKNEWSKSTITRLFSQKFKERVYHEEIESYRKDLYAATYRLHTMIKQYLALKPIIMDWGRTFHGENKGL